MCARNHLSSPSVAIAHVICWKTESRSVLENRRTTTAFAPGLASITSTMASDMNEPLVAPAVGLTVLVEALALEQPRCGGSVLVAWQRGGADRGEQRLLERRLLLFSPSLNSRCSLFLGSPIQR